MQGELLHLLGAHVDQVLRRVLIVIVLGVGDCEELVAALIKEKSVDVSTVFEQFKILLQIAAKFFMALVACHAHAELDDIAQVLPLSTSLC